MMIVAVGYPLKTVLSMAAPRTAADARETARRLNAEARRDRARKDREHQQRQAAIDEQRRRLDAYGPVQPARARINVGQVYRVRAAVTEDEREKITAAPPRPRTLAQLARGYYGDAVGSETLIAVGRRGGGAPSPAVEADGVARRRDSRAPPGGRPAGPTDRGRGPGAAAVDGREEGRSGSTGAAG